MRPLAPHRRRAPRGLRLVGALLALALLAPPAGASVWPPYGVSLGTDQYAFYGARVFPNTDGGASLSYFARYGGTQTSPLSGFFQVAVDGTVNPSINPSEGTEACSDGATGLYFAFGTYLQRWPAPPGWSSSTAHFTLPSSSWLGTRCALTSAGGCLMGWAGDDQVDAGIVRSDGTVDPGWPAAGLAIGVPYAANDPVRVAGDDAGGGYVAWWGSTGTSSVQLVLARVTFDGSLAPGWPIVIRQGVLNAALPPGLMKLPGGDALVSWQIGSAQSFGAQPFYLQRVRPDGTIAPGWPATGLVVRGALDITGVPSLLPDDADGAFLVWATRPPSGGSDVRAIHVTGSGALAPGWSSSGLIVTSPSASYVATIGSETGTYSAFPLAYNFRAAPDGNGGLFVGWEDARGAAGASVWITHWTGGGIPGDGWTVDGREVSDPTLLSHLGGIAPAPGGSAYVAYSAVVNNFPPFGYSHAWLERVPPETPVPALVSLVSAAALDGRVRVEWSLGGGSVTATVYRSVAGGAWMRVATLTPDGTGRIAYEDAAVVAGTRYGYRLGISEGGVETFAGEAWVDVPRLALALEGARPNPSPGGGLATAFTLEDGSPARLEALDLAGRRVASAEVGSLGPGRHVVTLARAVPPGMYLLRLTQSRHDVRARATVLP